MDKELELLKLNIQRFAEKKADNEIETSDEDIDDQNIEDEEVNGTEIATGEDGQDDSSEETIDQTKAFSNRLKEKTIELEQKYSSEADQKVEDRLNEVAKLHGFETWENYEESVNKDLMIEAGVDDPEKIEKVVQKMISQNPEVIKAKKIIEQTEKNNYDRKINEQIELINKIDSSIKTIDDLSKLDNCNAITDKVKNGYDLYDAYVICNLDKIQTSKIEFGKKQAIIDIDSKNHLKTTSGKQSTNVEVPKEIYDIYKKNTKMSDEQIKEHYKKSLEG